MNERQTYLLPSADGLIFFKADTPLSFPMMDYCATHTFREIRHSEYGPCLDMPSCRALYNQLSPISCRIRPQRFFNEIQDDKNLLHAIHKYKRKYPHSICSYTDDWLPDTDIPEFARKIGIRFRLKPYFVRLHYQKASRQEPQVIMKGSVPTQSLFCAVTADNFDITLNKIVSVISDKEAPTYHRSADVINRILTDTTLNDKEKQTKMNAYLRKISPAERNIIRYVFRDSPDTIDLKSAIDHELKHVINEILLSARRGKPSCGKLNAEQMRLLFIHDEISASSKEILSALTRATRQEELPEESELYLLIPLHYKKFQKASKEERLNMLSKPQPIIRELAKNWLKHNYIFYQTQFRELFTNLPASYPVSLWSEQAQNDDKEYQIQKSMLYCMETTDPKTGRIRCINCANVVDDSTFDLAEELKPIIEKVQEQYRLQARQLADLGITDTLIRTARQRNYQYIRHCAESAPSRDYSVVSQALRKYIVPFQKDNKSASL